MYTEGGEWWDLTSCLAGYESDEEGRGGEEDGGKVWEEEGREERRKEKKKRNNLYHCVENDCIHTLTIGTIRETFVLCFETLHSLVNRETDGGNFHSLRLI